jgi:hypothetical protein
MFVHYTIISYQIKKVNFRGHFFKNFCYFDL